MCLFLLDFNLISVDEIQFLLQVITLSFINYIHNYSCNIMVAVAELKEQIFNAIRNLRNNKKQPMRKQFIELSLKQLNH